MAELTQAEKELFGKIKSTGNRPPNFRHGKYLLMVDKWHLHRGFKNVLTDVKNFVVLSASPNPVDQDGKIVTETPNEAGSLAGIAAKLSQGDTKGEMAMMNVYRFLFGMWNISDADVDDDDKISAWQRATNDDPKKFANDKTEDGQPIPAVNPCRGMIIGMETAAVFTRDSKRWIVTNNWIHVAVPGEGENSYQKAAERWANYEARIKAGGVFTPPAAA